MTCTCTCKLKKYIHYYNINGDKLGNTKKMDILEQSCTMITHLAGEHFITIATANEQSPRWVDCDTTKRLEISVTNAAKELSTSSEHVDSITISYIDNVIAVDT